MKTNKFWGIIPVIVLTLILGACFLPDEEHKHTMSEWELQYEPVGCGTPGYEQRFCTYVYDEGYSCNYWEGREIPPTGEHTFTGILSVEIAPTCTANGTGLRYCSVCNFAETKSAPNNLPPNGHDWNVLSTEIYPSCTTTGTGVKKCLVCNEVDSSKDNIPPTGHTYTYTTIIYPATCVSPGSQKGACGCGATTSRNIPPLGHNWKGSGSGGVICGRCFIWSPRAY